jgi:hypothetical protein
MKKFIAILVIVTSIIGLAYQAEKRQEIKVGDCFVEKDNTISYYEERGIHQVRAVSDDSYWTFFYTSEKWDRSDGKVTLKNKHAAWNISVVYKNLGKQIKVPCFRDKKESEAFSRAIELEKKIHKKYYEEEK